MSTILKALRRLEEETANRRAKRPLRDDVVAAESRPPGRLVSRLLVILGVAVLGLGAGVVWMVVGGPGASSILPTGDPGADGAAVSTAPAPVPDSAPARVVDRAPVPAIVPDSGPAGEPVAAPAYVPSSAPPLAPSVVPAPPEVPPGSQESASLAARREFAAMSRERETQSASPSIAVREADLTAEPARSPAWEVPATPEPALAAAPAVEAVAPIDEPAQKPIPVLVVLGTRWHPTRERRTVEILLPDLGRRVTLQEGDSIGSLRVSEITLSGVIFDHDGVEIQRRVSE